MQLAALESLDVILILVAVGLLVFGSSKLPKIARGLGSAKTEFEKGIKEGQDKAAAKDDTAEKSDTTEKSEKPAS